MRNGCDEALSVRVLRVHEHVCSRTLLNQIALFHHDHAVGDFRNHAEVVRDKHDTHAFTFLNLAYEVQNLRLRRNIECCRGFVSDQDIGVERQSHSDHDTLTLST